MKKPVKEYWRKEGGTLFERTNSEKYLFSYSFYVVLTFNRES